MRPVRPISVIIPAYNAERFLPAAVDSIRRQAVGVLEILVVDDGSTDATGSLALELGSEVRVLQQANSGAPAARNLGLSHAAGELIAFLDADDLWTGDKLTVQLARLEADPDLAVVLGCTQLVRQVDGETGASLEPLGPPGLLTSLGAALFRRSAFERVGRLNEGLRMDDDVDWFLRAIELDLPLTTVPHVSQLYRRHGGNITNARQMDMRFFVRALKLSLDRRRQASGGAARALPPWLRERPGG